MPGHSKPSRSWWLNPAFTGQTVEPLDGLAEFPAGSVELVDQHRPRQGQTVTDTVPVTIEHGTFAPLAALLFMINGHRPGAIRGFYVVVEAIKGKAWSVGQMHADAVTPLRVFSDKLYDSEAAARVAAEAMRLGDVGNAPPRA